MTAHAPPADMTRELTVVVTAHSEGNMLYTALASYGSARNYAELRGAKIRFVVVLDDADEQTSRAARFHPALRDQDQMISVAFRNPSEARNHGAGLAGPGYVAMLDGDDLISQAYFHLHLEVALGGASGTIWHPQYVISFGAEQTLIEQPDQVDDRITPAILGSSNPWVSAAMAERELFLRIPYVPCRTAQTGLGYEDWHWNCETMAHGCRHAVARGTAYYYRKKQTGSVNLAAGRLGAILPRTTLFPGSACL